MSNDKHFDEEAVVRGCTRNDRSCQEVLYRRFFGTMMAMCRRHTDDRELAMTLCNDGFLKVFMKIHTFSGKGSLEGWIRRIVYHSIADYFRVNSNTRYLQHMVFADVEAGDIRSADHDLHLQDLLNMLRSLPETSATVFELFAIKGYSHKEIAEKLGINENTSKWHLSNARRRLQEMLKNQDKNHVRRAEQN